MPNPLPSCGCQVTFELYRSYFSSFHEENLIMQRIFMEIIKYLIWSHLRNWHCQLRYNIKMLNYIRIGITVWLATYNMTNNLQPAFLMHIFNTGKSHANLLKTSLRSYVATVGILGFIPIYTCLDTQKNPTAKQLQFTISILQSTLYYCSNTCQ